MPRKRKRGARQTLSSKKAAATAEVAHSEKTIERPLFSLAFLAENPLDEILSFCSGFDLGRLSLTCSALRTSAEQYAERETRSLVSSRRHIPGQCRDEFGLCCTPSIPLNWSWAGRLERLRSRDCMPGVELYLYGHCFKTDEERSGGARELWEAARIYLDAEPGDAIEDIVVGSNDVMCSAKVGAGNDGAVFSAKLSKKIPASKKLGFCRALVNRTDVFRDINLPSYGMAHPMVLDTWEVLIVSPPGLSKGDEKVTRTFNIPPLAPTEPFVTFKTVLVHKCWRCGLELKERGSACERCGEDKWKPFSSNPDVARTLAGMEDEEDDIEPVTVFELRSGIVRDLPVLGRATVQYLNWHDHDPGEKAGPTVTRMESFHPAGSAPLHSKLLDSIMEWVEIVFPHPTELQMHQSVWQEEVSYGEELLHSRGWHDITDEGDFEVVIGTQKEDSEHNTNSSDGANGTDNDGSGSDGDGDGDGDGDDDRSSESDSFLIIRLI